MLEDTVNELYAENKALKKELKDLKEEYKELFEDSEEVRAEYGGLILLVEGFVDKAKDMI